jgi:pantetheine-phosphate adenylyltransferase
MAKRGQLILNVNENAQLEEHKSLIKLACEMMIKNSSGDPMLFIEIVSEFPLGWTLVQMLLKEYYQAAVETNWKMGNPLAQVTVLFQQFSTRIPDESFDFKFVAHHHGPHDPREIYLNGKSSANHETKWDLETLDQTHDSVVVGGTFDHLHCGHKILLSMAATLARKRLTVGVTNLTRERLHKKKGYPRMESLDARLQAVKSFLSQFKPQLELDIVAIDDDFGPTLTDPNMDAIVGSQETAKGCEMVNEQRKERNLSILKIYLVECLTPSNGPAEDSIRNKISSSEIRSFIRFHRH